MFIEKGVDHENLSMVRKKDPEVRSGIYKNQERPVY